MTATSRSTPRSNPPDGMSSSSGSELAKPVREARLERLYTEITAPGSMASNELADLANAAGSVNAGGSIV